MADADTQVIDDLPSYDQLQREAVAALREIVRDKDAPAAARAAAVKELRGLMEEDAGQAFTASDDPSEMTLADIDREIAHLDNLLESVSAQNAQ